MFCLRWQAEQVATGGMTPIRALALHLALLAATSGEVPTTKVSGDIDYKAVKCAACDFLVEHLDGLVGTHELAGTAFAAAKRGKRRVKADKVAIPWAESELGWSAAVEQACSFEILRQLAYLTRSGSEFKLMNVTEMDDDMRAMAMAHNLTLDKDAGMYRQFESACEDVLDKSPKKLVKLVRDAKRTQVDVQTPYSKGKSVGKKMVPIAGPETMRAAFCVDAVKVCPSSRFPRAGKEKPPHEDLGPGDPVYGHAYDDF